MGIFSQDSEPWNQLDWALLQNGPITMYWRPEILNDHVNQLRNKGYVISEIPCSDWETVEDFHNAIASQLNFPSYYGRNLDAFNNCLGDIDIPDECSGRVIVFKRYDHFNSICPDAAQAVLDVCACKAWTHILFGHRLIILLQSDDPELLFSPVGGFHVDWNHAEWLNKNRGL